MIRASRITSVLEVLKVNAQGFIATSQLYAVISTTLKQGGQITPSAIQLLIKKASELRQRCEELDLPLSALKLQELEDRLGGYDAADRVELVRLIDDALSRMHDEWASRLVFVIEPRRAHLYSDVAPFGRSVAERFPLAATDIEEAGKCLALDRGTACVFHLMRVMEVGLRHLANELGIPYAPSWESYINQINTRIAEKHKKKGIRWKRDEPYFKEIAGDLLTVKVAWRNPTMHVVRRYTPEEAEQVFAAVRSLMQRIATKVTL